MSQSRRTMSHPPVLSTRDHAAAEAALLSSVTAVLDASETTEDLPEIAGLVVPDSPAPLWTSVARTTITVEPVDCIPAELRDWVAPAIVVHAH
jgi:hypothetical protein